MNNHKTKQRFMAMMLSALMVVGMMPIPVSAKASTLHIGASDEPDTVKAVSGAAVVIDETDTLAPTVVSVSVPSDALYKAGSDLNFTVTFSESVILMGTPHLDITVGSTDCKATYISKTEATLTFRYTVQPGDLDEDGISLGSVLSLNGGTIVDVAGNEAKLTLQGLGSTTGVLVDAVPPRMMRAEYADNTHIKVILSEPSNIFGKEGEFIVTRTGTTTTYPVGAVPLFGSSPTVWLTVEDMSAAAADGVTVTYRKFGTYGVVIDEAGNYMDTDPVGVDVTPWVDASVVSVSSPFNRSYMAGETIPITVTFSTAVTVTGTPLLLLKTGAINRNATYSSGSGSKVLTFHYTVQPGDSSPKLEYVSTTALSLNGGRIYNERMDANLTLPLPGFAYTGSLGANASISLDTLDPYVKFVYVPSEDTYIKGEKLSFSVYFNETVGVSTAGGTPYLTLTIGSNSRRAYYVGGSGTTRLWFEYSIQSGELDTDGIDLEMDISLNGGTIRDGAGNDSGLTLKSVGETTDVRVDAIAPTIIGAVYEDNTHIIVMLSEVGWDSVKANDGGFTVTQTGTDKTYKVLATQIGLNRTVKLTVADMSTMGSEGVTVTYTKGGNGTITDSAGNRLETDSVGAVVEVWDVMVPAAPSMPDLEASSDSGVSDSDNITNNTTPTFVGTAEAGSTVVLYADSRLIGMVDADENGNWRSTSILQLSGLYTITATTMNRIGYKSSASEALIVKIDTTAPTAMVTMSDTTLISGESYQVMFSFSEPVTGFTNSDLTADKGTLTPVVLVDNDKTYTATFTADEVSDDTNTIILNLTGIEDIAGNTGIGTTATSNYTIEFPLPPGAPTFVTATEGDGCATVSFMPPASDGRATARNYTVTASPGGFSATGNASPITVRGLTNGVTYTFIVVASNAAGTGAPSLESNPVTPQAPSTGGGDSGESGSPGGGNSGDNGSSGGDNTGDNGSSGGDNTGDNGSSGGDNSGDIGSSSGTVVPAPEVKPDQPVTAEVSVTAKAGANGTATTVITDKIVTATIAKAQADAESQGKTTNGIAVELAVTMPKGTVSLTTTLSMASLNSLLSTGVSSLSLTGSPVNVSFDLMALKEIQKQSSGAISISIAPAVGLVKATRVLMGNRPVYNIIITYTDKNGKFKSISSLGNGTATLSIPYTPDENEVVGYLYGVYVDGKGKLQRIPGSAYDVNSRSLLIPTDHFSMYGVGYAAPSTKFTDIDNHWGKEAIDYVVGSGLLSGTSKTTFTPDTAMTRGLLVTALGRLAGVDAKEYTTNSFTDVKTDSPFRPYIEWAYKNGILQGIGNQQFAPDRAVTREEIAVIFVNYARATGYKLPVIREATAYTDASDIGSVYKTAVIVTQQAGIMMGCTDNRFNPKSNATRAEVSSMLHRYIKLTINPGTAQGWALNDAGQWLYYRDGKPLTAMQIIDGAKYFFNTDGTLKTGWVKDGDKWYYFFVDYSLANNPKVDALLND